jgi:predicted RNase H-like HicB family nuclease
MAAYSYPAIFQPDEDGRLVVRFPDLREALTDGADEPEALREAADCLSEALASRIVDGEEIPAPGSLAAGQYLISPDPTIALKAALYDAMRASDMTVADLAERLGMGDWHQAARLLDPRRSSKLTGLAAALGALGLRISVSVEADPAGPVQIGAAASASTDAGASAVVGLVHEELTRRSRKLEELEVAGHALPRFAGKPTERLGRPAQRKLRDLAAAITRMLARGKERGYLTYEELNAALPPDQVSSQQIEDTMTVLSELGINVIENEESQEPAAAESDASSSGEVRIEIEDGRRLVMRRVRNSRTGQFENRDQVPAGDRERPGAASSRRRRPARSPD